MKRILIAATLFTTLLSLARGQTAFGDGEAELLLLPAPPAVLPGEAFLTGPVQSSASLYGGTLTLVGSGDAVELRIDNPTEQPIRFSETLQLSHVRANRLARMLPFPEQVALEPLQLTVPAGANVAVALGEVHRSGLQPFEYATTRVVLLGESQVATQLTLTNEGSTL